MMAVGWHARYCLRLVVITSQRLVASQGTYRFHSLPALASYSSLLVSYESQRLNWTYRLRPWLSEAWLFPIREVSLPFFSLLLSSSFLSVVLGCQCKVPNENATPGIDILQGRPRDVPTRLINQNL